jgi:hypothetical protein
MMVRVIGMNTVVIYQQENQSLILLRRIHVPPTCIVMSRGCFSKDGLKRNFPKEKENPQPVEFYLLHHPGVMARVEVNPGL